MATGPRISLCIPTYNRVDYLTGALLTGLREAASLPAGTVEVLVIDNASTDNTAELIARIQTDHPELRAFRNPENMGFDRNYLRCIEEARGEFVWVLGDDDEWVSGSVARVLRELDAGADACLCLSQACDLDLNPIVILPWYLDPETPAVWHLNTREDLIHYFDNCARNAGVFAFVSVVVFRKARFMAHWALNHQAIGTGYVHLLGMLRAIRDPFQLHYISEVLVLNRLNDEGGVVDPFNRWMQDLRFWGKVADELMGDDPDLLAAFFLIVGRNHHDTILPGLRRSAPSEAAWMEAKSYLLRAGFSAVRIAAVDFAYRHVFHDFLPMSSLNPDTLCLVDLPILARGAQRIAILAMGGLENILHGASLLAALRRDGRIGHVRVFCPAACAGLLEGFDVLCVEPKRYIDDMAYRDSIAQTLIDYSPELAVNLDRNRAIEADDLLSAFLPAGALAYRLPDRGQDETLIKALNGQYRYLLPQDAGSEVMLHALGIVPAKAELWPASASLEEARAVLAGLDWDSARTLAVIVDHPSIPAQPAFQSDLDAAVTGDWNLVGIGGRGTYALLESILGPGEGRAVNLAGSMDLVSIGALLKNCAGFLGGTPLLQSLAKACGCAPILQKREHQIVGSGLSEK